MMSIANSPRVALKCENTYSGLYNRVVIVTNSWPALFLSSCGSLKTRCVQRMMRVKYVEARSPHVGGWVGETT
ncbi:hypothetical protein TNCV_1755551 [Trichonephila clavipes]|nr:hypothetical protein TNCV_1755551 [Trichonephila clavipes]